jgi:ApaG protein
MQDKAKHDIRVEAKMTYIDESSNPDKDRYVFAYTITIRNEGSEAATLLGRHWVITDSNGRIQEVRGDGVVGEQPYLKPGEAYEYTSGAMLDTPVGAMRGSYQMVDDQGERFEAPISSFTLSIPRTLH